MISRIRGLLDVRLAGIALAVEDLEKSIAWWEEVLEFELVSRSRVEAVGADAAIVRGAGIYIELLEAPGRYRIDALFADPPNHLLPVGNKALVFETGDITKLTAELEVRDVTFVWKSVDLGPAIGVGTAIRDGEGNLISFIHKIPRTTEH